MAKFYIQTFKARIDDISELDINDKDYYEAAVVNRTPTKKRSIFKNYSRTNPKFDAQRRVLKKKVVDETQLPINKAPRGDRYIQPR